MSFLQSCHIGFCKGVTHEFGQEIKNIPLSLLSLFFFVTVDFDIMFVDIL